MCKGREEKSHREETLGDEGRKKGVGSEGEGELGVGRPK